MTTRASFDDITNSWIELSDLGLAGPDCETEALDDPGMDPRTDEDMRALEEPTHAERKADAEDARDFLMTMRAWR